MLDYYLYDLCLLLDANAKEYPSEAYTLVYVYIFAYLRTKLHRETSNERTERREDDKTQLQMHKSYKAYVIVGSILYFISFVTKFYLSSLLRQYRTTTNSFEDNFEGKWNK